MQIESYTLYLATLVAMSNKKTREPLLFLFSKGRHASESRNGHAFKFPRDVLHATKVIVSDRKGLHSLFYVT
jgi:hypothetical protein